MTQATDSPTCEVAEVRTSILAGVVCGVVTYTTAPRVRRYLLRRGSVDVPNHRSSHAQPTPRGGGLACTVGVATGLVVAGRSSRLPLATLAGIATVTAIGLADDLSGGLDPRLRLAVQTVSGAAFAPSAALAPMGSVITAGVVNVVNFMDGINGITGSTAVVWGVATLLTADRDTLLQVVGAITAGAGVGFLPWNAPTAHLFLGDVGSYLFGALMAACITHVAATPSKGWVIAAPLLPYGLDAAQALVRRWRAGQSLTEAHREHVYQRLVDDHGLSHAQVSAIHAGTASLIAAATRTMRPGAGIASAVALAAGYVLLPVGAQMIGISSPTVHDRAGAKLPQDTTRGSEAL